MKKSLIFAIFLQILVFFAFLFYALFPIILGEKITLKISGFDPRDILLGNYIYLKFDDLSDIPNTLNFKKDEEIYFSLKDEKGIFKPKNISKTKPKNGIFIKGKIERIYFKNKKSFVNIRFGIEKFYKDKKTALKFQKTLNNNSALANIYIYKGIPRIQSLKIP